MDSVGQCPCDFHCSVHVVLYCHIVCLGDSFEIDSFSDKVWHDFPWDDVDICSLLLVLSLGLWLFLIGSFWGLYLFCLCGWDFVGRGPFLLFFQGLYCLFVSVLLCMEGCVLFYLCLYISDVSSQSFCCFCLSLFVYVDVVKGEGYIVPYMSRKLSLLVSISLVRSLLDVLSGCGC